VRRRIVLDTNCLLQSISRKGRYYRVWCAFLDGEYDLCVTTEILEEYEEIIGRYSSSHALLFMFRDIRYAIRDGDLQDTRRAV